MSRTGNKAQAESLTRQHRGKIIGAAVVAAAAVFGLLSLGNITLSKGSLVHEAGVVSGPILVAGDPAATEANIEEATGITVSVGDDKAPEYTEYATDEIGKGAIDAALSATKETLANEAADGIDPVGATELDENGDPIAYDSSQAEVDTNKIDTVKAEYAGITSVEGLLGTRYGILTKYTMIDTQAGVEGMTIDKFWADSQFAVEHIIGQYDGYSPVYAVSEDSTYLIAITDQGTFNGGTAQAIDWAFARMNTLGQVVDDCFYDPESGIAFIPRSAFEDTDGNVTTLNIQHQLLIPVDKATREASTIAVQIFNNDDHDRSVAKEYSAKFDIFDVDLSIPVVDVANSPDFTLDNFRVTVNDLGYELVEGESAFYDQTNGVLTINVHPAAVSNINVYIIPDKKDVLPVETFIDRITGTDKANADAVVSHNPANWNIAGKLVDWDPDTYYEGYRSWYYATGIYGRVNGYNQDWVYLRDYVYSIPGSPGSDPLAEAVYSGSWSAVYNYIESWDAGRSGYQFGTDATWASSVASSMYFIGVTPPSFATEIPELGWGKYLALACSESTVAGNDGLAETGVGFDTYCYYTVLKYGDDWVVLGFVTPNCGQSGVGMLKFKYEAKGGVRAVKQDIDTADMPQGDGTLAGAEFQVKQGDTVVGTLTTQLNNGVYEAVSDKNAYKKGDYVVHESKPPTGYDISSDDQNVTVVPSQITDVQFPYTDTIWRGDIEVVKYDDTTKTSDTQGNSPDFAGINFNIINRSANAVQSPEDPTRLVQPGEVVCTITTKKDGNVYKASTKNTGVNKKSVGSGTWNTPDGWHGALAYGQYEVVEVTTAEGYLLGSWTGDTQKVFHGAATTNGTAQTAWLGDNGLSVSPSSDAKWINADKALVSFTSGAANAAQNTVMRGDIELIKYDDNFGRSEAQGDATLEGAQFDIINRSKKAVVSPEDGTTLVQPGEVVCRITTKKDGNVYKASTAATGNQKKSGEGTWSKPSAWHGALAYGEYEVVEVGAPSAGYMLGVYEGETPTIWHGFATVQGKYERQWLQPNGAAFLPSAEPYWINADKVVVQFNDKDHGPHDTVMRGDVELVKYDDTLKRSEAQGNATLEDIQFDIINRSAGNVISPEDGVTEIAPGEVVCRITTKYVDGAYRASTQAKGVNQKKDGSGTWDTPAGWHGALAYGQYQIKEVEPSIGYMLGKWNNDTQKIWNGAVSTNGQATSSWNTTAKDDVYASDSDPKWINADKALVTFDKQTQGPNNTVMRGDLDVQKADAELEATDSTNAVDRQGMALLANCYIEIYNRSDAVVVSPEDGREVQPGELVCTIITDKDGYASTELTAERIAINKWDNCFAKANGWHGALAYGEYEVIERQPSEGYMLNQTWHGMAVDYNAASVKTPNDYAVHEGAEKEVIKPNSEQTWINADKVHLTFGHKDGAGDEANKASWLPEQVIRGGVRVGKVDRQNQMYKAQGKADLENHVIAVYSRNLHPVKIHAISSEVSNRAASEDVVLPAWDSTSTAQSASSTMMKLGTQTRDGVLVAYLNTKQIEENGQIKYVAETDVDTLPYGIYRLKEVFVPSKSGYLFDQISADWYEDFAIGSNFSHREFAGQTAYAESISNFVKDETYHTTVTPTEQDADQTYVDLTNDPKYCFSNYVLRGDVIIHKKKDNTNSDVLEFVPFVIVSKTTGEAHIVVTDKNGDASTMINNQASKLQNEDTGEVPGYTLHTFETNSNDEGVLALADGSKIPALALDENSENGLADISTIITTDSKGNILGANGETPDFQWAYGTWFNGRVDTPTANIRMAWQSADWKTGGTNYITYEVEDATIDNMLGALPFDDYVVFELKVPDREVTDIVDGETFTVLGNEKVILVANGSFSVTNTNGEYVNMADSASREDKEVIGWSNPTQADIRSGRYPQDVTLDNQQMLGIGTTLTDAEGNHVINANGTITLYDTVQYDGAEIGEQYTIKGELHKVGVDGEGNKVDDGIVAYGETSFPATTAAGEAVVEFTIDSTELAGEQLVAFEYMLNASGACVGYHEDIDDEGQTVGIVDIRTTLTDDEGSKEICSYEPVTLVDSVEYKGVVEGHEYTMTGTLHIKNADGTDGGELLDAEGNPFTVSQTFVPESSNGFVEITFEIPAGIIASKQVVAFETLYENGIQVAIHADINDEDQTVYSPGIETTALDGITSDHLGLAEGEITLNDIVAYTNLVKGHTYTVDGTIMDRETGAELKTAEGDVIKGKKTFVAGYKDDGTVDESATVSKFGDTELVSGFIEVPFHPNAEDVKGKAIVVFEKLYSGEDENPPEPEGDHEIEISKTDAATSEELPGATLIIEKDGEQIAKWISTDEPHMVKLDEGTYTLTEITAPKGYEVAETIEFTVDENGLVDGEKVEMKDAPVDIPEGDIEIEISKTDAATTEELPGATLVVTQNGVTIDQWVSTDEPHKIKLEEGTYELTEITAPDGYDVAETITFKVGEDGLVEGDKVEMKDAPDNDKPVAIHEDINDDNQSVYYPEIQTLAQVNGNKAGVTAAGEVHLTDTVSYTNLIPGREYVMEGVLMDKVTGQVAVTPEGQQITASATFVPETASGTMTMEFVFNARALQFHDVVVFENAYTAHSEVADELIHVAKHEDINDAAQTVGFGEDDLADELITATGDETANLIAIIAAAAVALAGTVAIRRKSAK